MSLEVGSAYVDIQPKLGAGFFSKLGGSLGGLKKVGLAAGAVLGAGLAAGAAGAFAAFKVGENFDEAFDTIRVGTGATGDALTDLKQDFKDTFSDVPASMQDAATAIADLNTRTGLTGEPLQDLAKNFLEVTRMTGGDLAGNIENVTRLFGDWGVAGEDQSATMDKLFRASQATGIGLNELSTGVVAYGAPLRSLGFTMDESIGLFAKWNKEGVNTEAIMGGLKQAVGRFAKEGKDVPEAFNAVLDSIGAAGSMSEASAIAIEAFGMRAGPDLAAAVREGRFEMDDLLGVIGDGEETIMGAASDTESFGEKWKKFANKLMVAVEPVATRVFEAIGNAMDALAPHIPAIIDGFESFFSLVGGWIATGARLWNEYKDEIIGFITTAWDGLQGFIDFVRGVFESLRGIFASDDGGGAAAFGGKWAEIWGKVQETFATAVELIMVVWDLLVQGWEKYGDRILQNVEVVWNTIQDVIGGALDIIKGIFDVFIGIFTGDWEKAWDGIKAIATGAIDIIKGLFNLFWDNLKLAFQLGWDAVQLLWDRLWESIKSAATAAIGVVTGWISGWWTTLTGKFTDIKNTVVETWGKLWDGLKGKARDGWNAFIKWLQGAWDLFYSWWHGAWSTAKEAVAGMWNSIVGVVKYAFNSVLRAIGRGINAAIDVINKAIRGANIINPFKDIPYVSHVSIPQLHSGGTVTETGLVNIQPDEEIVNLPTGASVVPLDKLDGGGRPYNVTLVLDGRVLARATGPHLVDDLVLHSGQRG